MELDEVLAIGFGIFLGVTIASILDSVERKRTSANAELYGKPEHIITSRGRMLVVEVDESLNVVSIVDAVSKTRI